MLKRATLWLSTSKIIRVEVSLSHTRAFGFLSRPNVSWQACFLPCVCIRRFKSSRFPSNEVEWVAQKFVNSSILSRLPRSRQVNGTCAARKASTFVTRRLRSSPFLVVYFRMRSLFCVCIFLSKK